MNEYTDSLLSFAEILAKDAAQQMPNTVVIEATIIDDEETQAAMDLSKREYRAQYLDQYLTVYAAHQNEIYNNGDKVYVLVPEGDFGKNKIIISSSTPNIVSYSNVETGNTLSVSENLFTPLQEIRMRTFNNGISVFDGEKYVEVPKQLSYDENGEIETISFTKIDENGVEKTFEKKLYEPETYYDLNVFGDNNSEYNFIKACSHYLKDYKTFRFSAKIRTDIIPTQQLRGNYGLSLSIPVKSKTTTGDYIQLPPKECILDVNSILGNPYKLQEWSIQTLNVVFNENEELDIGIDNITKEPRQLKLQAFIKDFPENSSYEEDEDGNLIITDPCDIFIKDISFDVYTTLQESNKEGYYLHLQASDGNIFFGPKEPSEVNPNPMTQKVLIPTLKYNGKTVTLNGDNEKIKEQYLCYWFVEDASIKTNSELYVSYAGVGWRCLNNRINISYNDENAEQFDYLTNQYTYIVPRTDVLSSIRYKCVIVVTDTVNNVIQYSTIVEAVIRLEEFVDPLVVKLTSATGSTIYPEFDSIIDLICSVEGTYHKPHENSSIYFEWNRSNYINEYIDSNFYTVKAEDEKMQEITFASEKILNKLNIITCSVYDQYTDDVDDDIIITRLLGTATIAINLQDIAASATLQNGNILFKYDADGDAPTSPKFDGQLGSKIIIRPLELTIYNAQTGLELTEEEYRKCKIKWYAPGEDYSLIIPMMGKDDETISAEQNNMTPAPVSDEENSNISDVDDVENQNSFEVNEKREEHTFTLTNKTKSEYSFKYAIANTYDYNKANNDALKVEVTYNQKKQILPANLKFMKDGDNGTNNSNYTIVITHQGDAYGETFPKDIIEKDTEGNIIDSTVVNVEQKLQLVYIQGKYITKLDDNGEPIYEIYYKQAVDKDGNPKFDKDGNPVYEKDKNNKYIIEKEILQEELIPFNNRAHWHYHNLVTDEVVLMAEMLKKEDADPNDNSESAFTELTLYDDLLPYLNLKIYHAGKEIPFDKSLMKVEWSVFDYQSTDATILLRGGEKTDIDAWNTTVTGPSCQIAPLNLEKEIIDEKEVINRWIPRWKSEVDGNRFNPVNIVQARVRIYDTADAASNDTGTSSLFNQYTELYAYYPIEIVMVDDMKIIVDATSDEEKYCIPNIKGGFSFVTYSSNGKTPKYNNTTPFECVDGIYNESDYEYNNYHWFSSDNLTIDGIEVNTEIVTDSNKTYVTPKGSYNSKIVQNYIRAELDNLGVYENKIEKLQEEQAELNNDIAFLNALERTLFYKVKEDNKTKVAGLLIDMITKSNLPISNSQAFLKYRYELYTQIVELQNKYNNLVKKYILEQDNLNFWELRSCLFDKKFTVDVYDETTGSFVTIIDKPLYIETKQTEGDKVIGLEINTDIFEPFAIDKEDASIYKSNLTKKQLTAAKKAIDTYNKYLNNTIINKKIKNFNELKMNDNKSTYNAKEGYYAFDALQVSYFDLFTQFYTVFHQENIQTYYGTHLKKLSTIFTEDYPTIEPNNDKEVVDAIVYFINTDSWLLTLQDVKLLQGRSLEYIGTFYDKYKTDIGYKDKETFLSVYQRAQNDFLKETERYLLKDKGFFELMQMCHEDLYQRFYTLYSNFNNSNTSRTYANIRDNIINKTYSHIKNKWYNSEKKTLRKKITDPIAKLRDPRVKKSNNITLQLRQLQLSLESAKQEENAVILVYIRPIVMTYNKFELTAISGWDGSRLYVDTSNNAYLYAPQLGAGRVNPSGTFTGMVMGRKDVRFKTSSSAEEVGLFGYSDGKQSMFLNADTGAATFGVNDEIVLDPNGTSTIAGWDIDNGKFEFVSDTGTVGLYTLNKTSPTYPPNGTEKIAFQAGDIKKGTGSVITYDGHFYTTNGTITGGTISGTTLDEDIVIKKIKDSTIENCSITNSTIKDTLRTGIVSSDSEIGTKMPGVEISKSDGIRHYISFINEDNKVEFDYSQGKWSLATDEEGEANFKNFHCHDLFYIGDFETAVNYWQRYKTKSGIAEEFVIDKATIGQWTVNRGEITRIFTPNDKEGYYLTSKILKLENEINEKNEEVFSLTAQGDLFCKTLNVKEGFTGNIKTADNKTMQFKNGILIAVV